MFNNVLRRASRGLAVVLSIATLALNNSAEAAFFSYPRAMWQAPMRIVFDGPTLAPFAHSMFCVKYPADCQVHHIAFRGRKVQMTMRRWLDLVEVNADINHTIIPQHMNETVAGEKWLISPAYGDCNDFAVTKRHELLARGWPSRALLLAEAVTTWGEHHLILVIHVEEGDFIADNLHPHIRPWGSANYDWVRIQSPGNPQFWSKVGRASA